MINNKEQIIKYFEDGIKEEGNLKIGVEHEKFIFNKKDNKRIDYSSIIKMFDHLYEFGWKPVKENDKVIGLSKEDKNITLEPGNPVSYTHLTLPTILLV